MDRTLHDPLGLGSAPAGALGHSRLPQPEKPANPTQPFQAYLPGYFPVDLKYLPQMADETSRRYVFVAIDRATRWVFLAVKRAKTPAAARSFLHALAKAAPVKTRTILTDNGKEFTDRVFGQGAKDATGAHEFDALCQALGIEHRLTKPKSPRTNGMVEGFNGRLAQILRAHHFQNSLDLKTRLHRYAWLLQRTPPSKNRSTIKLRFRPSKHGNNPLRISSKKQYAIIRAMTSISTMGGRKLGPWRSMVFFKACSCRQTHGERALTSGRLPVTHGSRMCFGFSCSF
jgi:transposase InsO family protein